MSRVPCRLRRQRQQTGGASAGGERRGSKAPKTLADGSGGSCVVPGKRTGSARTALRKTRSPGGGAGVWMRLFIKNVEASANSGNRVEREASQVQAGVMDDSTAPARATPEKSSLTTKAKATAPTISTATKQRVTVLATAARRLRHLGSDAGTIVAVPPIGAAVELRVPVPPAGPALLFVGAVLRRGPPRGRVPGPAAAEAGELADGDAPPIRTRQHQPARTRQLQLTSRRTSHRKRTRTS